ncbi:hypothetical protein F5Y19DRAFT_335296 [Xylariaceae sp. FL1651]|nr:hypothetical protein F5Y19DRAFT_335296 [Xylariaceae sp. FL1651]
MESATHSFTSRRPAAGGLPQFHLPPPNTPLDSQIPSMAAPNRFLHYPSPPPTSSPSESRQETSPYLQHTFPHVVGSKHLTSSSGVTGSDGLSPLSSSVNSSSSQSSQAGITPYNPQNNWSMPGTSSYTYGSITPGGQASIMSSGYNRHIYSPGTPGAPGAPGAPGYNSRSSQSPATADGLAPPPYDNVSHPFPMSMSGGATSHSSFASQASHPQHLQHAILGSQSSQPPTPAATAPSDNYSRAPPTPGYYAAPSSTPQQTSFTAFPTAHPSPTQVSPSTTGPTARGIPALSSQQHSPMGAPPPYGGRHYGYPTLPSGLGGAVLSNMGNPGGQMHIMGAISPLGAYHPGHTLGPHHTLYPGPANSQQDRPYKCDVCPQSFNRNHDLKRHKRIHLAVKPFPCDHCDKAFSRKDALKRHRLVKGCGSNGKTSPNSGNDGSPIEDSKMDPDEASDHSRRVKNEPA